MAIGLGRMFGFEFLPNFNYPYISKSITEFWRRWHMSLSTWFREYLYIPLGGNRCPRVKWIRNLFLVWACTGLWHGASWNYLLWGLYFFAILLVEKLFLSAWLEKLHPILRHIYTMLLVLVSWTIFALEDFAQLTGYFRVMLGLGNAPVLNADTVYYIVNYAPVIFIGCLAATPVGTMVVHKLPAKYVGMLKPILLLMGLIICTSYLVAGTYNPFLYFRF